MWDARCSANFILLRKVSRKALRNPRAPVLFPRRRDFCSVRQLAAQPAARQRTLRFTSGSVRSEPLPSRTPRAHGRGWRGSGCSLTGGRAADGGSRPVTLLGASLGSSGDIALRHAVNSTDVVASAERAGSTRCRDLLVTVDTQTASSSSPFASEEPVVYFCNNINKINETLQN